MHSFAFPVDRSPLEAQIPFGAALPGKSRRHGEIVGYGRQCEVAVYCTFARSRQDGVV